MPLNGSVCATNGEIVIYKPSTVWFNCFYDNPPSVTTYTWTLDGVEQTEFKDKYSAYISIPSGTHEVECATMIYETDECQCKNSSTLTVTVVGKIYTELDLGPLFEIEPVVDN